MNKKSLLAAAVLSAATGLATAADVSLYGTVDYGLFYRNQSVTVDGVKAKEHSFGLESGVGSSSLFGLTGTEDLGNGLTVGFKLENGFNADDGALSDDAGRLFDREASLSVSGAYGTLSFGRMGGVGSSAGTYDVVYATADAFDGGDADVLGLAISSRYDNMITYQTPVFGGLQGTFQYSFKEDSKADDEREGSAFTDRYAGAAVTGAFGPLNTVVAYEFQNYSTAGLAANESVEDGHTVYLGGNFDFEVLQVFAMAQYFKGLKSKDVAFAALDDTFAEALDTRSEGLKGYGLHVGSVVPAAGGNLTLAAYYVDATMEQAAFGAKPADEDVSYLGFGAKYEYPLSKRTSVYTGAGYAKAKLDGSANVADGKLEVTQAYVGLTHNF